MKVFLSHAMSGLDEGSIMELRQRATDYLNQFYNDIEIIDNYHHENVPDDAGRLWHLGTSITQLDKADAIYFCDDSDANGCRVELLIANLYNLRVLNKKVGSIGDYTVLRNLEDNKNDVGC